VTVSGVYRMIELRDREADFEVDLHKFRHVFFDRSGTKATLWS
jgi:hypothetical protein